MISWTTFSYGGRFRTTWLTFFPQPQAPVGLSNVHTNKKNKNFERWVLISWLGKCAVIHSFYDLNVLM